MIGLANRFGADAGRGVMRHEYSVRSVESHYFVGIGGIESVLVAGQQLYNGVDILGHWRYNIVNERLVQLR